MKTLYRKYPRKIKKTLSRIFGKGTYIGILQGYLYIERTKRGHVIRYTGKKYKEGEVPFYPGQMTIHPDKYLRSYGKKLEI
jgi:hypothetical protein